MSVDFASSLYGPILREFGCEAVWNNGADHTVTLVKPTSKLVESGPGEFQVAAQEIKSGGMTADISAMKQGDSITAEGKSYKVLLADPDETGWTDIYLERA